MVGVWRVARVRVMAVPRTLALRCPAPAGAWARFPASHSAAGSCSSGCLMMSLLVAWSFAPESMAAKKLPIVAVAESATGLSGVGVVSTIATWTGGVCCVPAGSAAPPGLVGAFCLSAALKRMGRPSPLPGLHGLDRRESLLHCSQGRSPLHRWQTMKSSGEAHSPLLWPKPAQSQ